MPAGWAGSTTAQRTRSSAGSSTRAPPATIGDQLLLLEHPAVLTLGRNSDPAHILATRRRAGPARASPSSASSAAARSPITARASSWPTRSSGSTSASLLLRPFVRALEAALVATCAALGVAAARRDGHPGCWCDPDGPAPRKIGALGLRVERGVSYHGIALNVDVDLDDFALIDACGMPGVASTSIARERGDRDARPSTDAVERAAWIFADAFAEAIDAPLRREA